MVREPISYISLSKIGITSEIVITKSKFIGYAKSTFSESEAADFIGLAESKHTEASCICYAYQCGYDSNVQKYYDGHEPIGGKPILTTIKNHNLINTCVVVVRYFGGTKLGVGGLARAFANAANEAILLAEPKLFEKGSEINFTYSYGHNDKVQYYISNTDVEIIDTVYNQDVNITLRIKDSYKDKVITRINAITNGSCLYETVRKLYI